MFIYKLFELYKHFQISSKNIRNFAENFWQVRQNCILPVEIVFSWKIGNVRKICTFTFFFEFWPKTLQNFVGKPQPGFKNYLLHLFRGTFWITVSFSSKKKCILKELQGKCFWNSVKIFGHASENCFLCVLSGYLKNFFLFPQSFYTC